MTDSNKSEDSVRELVGLERDKFFETIRLRMIAVARKRVQGDHCQDVVQEAILILNTKIDQLQNDSEILPYAFTILRNCIGNHYKKTRREQRVIEFPGTLESVETSADERSDWQEVIGKALLYLKKESPRCAELFGAVLDSAGIAELQKLLNSTAENVYRSLYRCRARLRRILVEEMRIQLP